MNSVLSAFKSNKSDGSTSSGGKSKKPISPDNNNSYANLRHIREICTSAKMSAFVDDSDSERRIGMCPIQSPAISSGIETLPTQTNFSQSESNGASDAAHVADEVDHATTRVKPLPVTNVEHMRAGEKSVVTSASENANNNNSHAASQMSTNSLLLNASAIKSRPPRLSASSANSVREKSKENKENRLNAAESSKSTSDLSQCDDRDAASKSDSSADAGVVRRDPSTICAPKSNEGGEKPHTPVLSVASNRKDGKCSEPAATLPNKNGSRFHKRLSLTGIGNNTLPSVHGQAVPRGNGNGGANETKRTRTSTHQRNLSLDFR